LPEGAPRNPGQAANAKAQHFLHSIRVTLASFRGKEPAMRFTALVPMLQCDDIEATKAWYRSVLGFECVGEAMGTWCRLERDGAAITFMRNDHLGAPNATATQYIYVDDAMMLWDSIKDRCRAAWGPERMPYGMLEFAIKDLNGYLLSFGQRVG
jgi:catechol 2,3-dioxygenase-like lactoylglutathione lyase family enzyme